MSTSASGLEAGLPLSPRQEPRESDLHPPAEVAAPEPIVRHGFSTRLIHWTMTGFFFAAVLTGMPIWSPIFGWMAHLFGGLAVCRWLHPWTGVAYVASAIVLFFHWVGEMRLDSSDRGWAGPKLLRFLRHEGRELDVGKYNGGQKLLFWAVSLGALAMLVSGIVLWFPLTFPQALRLASIIVHDGVFVLFAVAIVFHVYLGTVALPGALKGMTRGTVSHAWARLHHPRWYREITGGNPPRE